MLAAWRSSRTANSTPDVPRISDSYSCTSTPGTLVGASPLPSGITTRWRTVRKVGMSGASSGHSDVSTKITSSHAWLTM